MGFQERWKFPLALEEIVSAPLSWWNWGPPRALCRLPKIVEILLSEQEPWLLHLLMDCWEVPFSIHS